MNPLGQTITKTAAQVREEALSTAKQFKVGWTDLGRILYSIHKDKMYREWGYDSFETYVMKEMGIRKQTSLKLLRSYSFLESDEPKFLHKDSMEKKKPVNIPECDTVDVLRTAKKKKDLSAEDYNRLKKGVFDTGQNASQVRKELTSLMKKREELSPAEARTKRRESNLKRLIALLKSLKQELQSGHLLPEKDIESIDRLIDRVGSEVN